MMSQTAVLGHWHLCRASDSLRPSTIFLPLFSNGWDMIRNNNNNHNKKKAKTEFLFFLVFVFFSWFVESCKWNIDRGTILDTLGVNVDCKKNKNKTCLHKNWPSVKSPGNCLLPPQTEGWPGGGDHDKYCLSTVFPSVHSGIPDKTDQDAVRFLVSRVKRSRVENHLPPRSQTVHRVFMSAIHIRNLRSATEAAVSFLMSWAHVCTFY